MSKDRERDVARKGHRIDDRLGEERPHREAGERSRTMSTFHLAGQQHKEYQINDGRDPSIYGA